LKELTLLFFKYTLLYSRSQYHFVVVFYIVIEVKLRKVNTANL
jgi:hypothetical protein